MMAISQVCSKACWFWFSYVSSVFRDEGMPFLWVGEGTSGGRVGDPLWGRRSWML